MQPFLWQLNLRPDCRQSEFLRMNPSCSFLLTAAMYIVRKPYHVTDRLYQYDYVLMESDSTIPPVNLSIFSLEENTFLKNAIVHYQITHPNDAGLTPYYYKDNLQNFFLPMIFCIP